MVRFKPLTSRDSKSKIRQVAKLMSGKGYHPGKIRPLYAGLVLLLILNAAVFATHPAAAADAVKWTKVNIPTEGRAGGWVLADGSDVQHVTLAGDGTLYAYGKDLAYTLYRSTDGGSWSHIGNVQHAIVGIATSPRDAGTIYYATTSAVYRSADGGQTFQALPGPGGAGAGNIEITSLAAGWLGGNVIAVGTRDVDASQFGGVYNLDEGDVVPGWADTGLGNYDVYAVAFSPGYSADRQLVAVVTDETDTFVTAMIGGAGWGAAIGDARLNKDNAVTHAPVAAAVSAAIAFPGDYDADTSSGSCVQYVAIDTGTGGGDVYKISSAEAPQDSAATDLNAGSPSNLGNIDITGLAAYGHAPSVSLLAGAADSAKIYFSADGGETWKRSRKEPTGESRTFVLVAPDSGNTVRAYAATSGDESAISISQDHGDTWNQLSLIDTGISNLVDLAPSPGYRQDNTLFLLTFGDEHSLWRSRDVGNAWERVFAGSLAEVDSLKLVALPPQYGDGSPTVFLAGNSDGLPAVWKSADGGQSFRRRFTRDPATGATFAIDAWAVADDNTLFIGSSGKVYRTANGGFSYSEGAAAGSQSLNSVALSPGYAQDKTILVGNRYGWVYLSDDNGASFGPLPAGATAAPLTDFLSVAFDPAFERNRTVYAASSTAGAGVYRFVIGTSADWERIDGTLPAAAELSRLVVAGDGTMYAARADDDGGMERCLNPAYSLGPTFETVTRGLGDGAALYGIWQSDHRLWSLDTANNRLMTFHDTLTSPVKGASPDNAASGTGNLNDHAVRNMDLDWGTLEGATSYRWQIDDDTDLSSVPSGFEGTTEASSAHLPDLEPATTYYWRVRASAPVLSPWSDKWYFTTILDTEVANIRLESPAAGAINVPVKPVFQWAAVVGADAYELMVSPEADFTSPPIIKEDDYALQATAWQCDLSLDNDTTYYWKVRAISASTRSAWSAVGAFVTEPPPPEVTTLPPPRTAPPPLTPPPEMLPAPTSTLMPLRTVTAPAVSPPQVAPPAPMIIQFPSPPDWAIYMIGGLLLAVILMLIIIMLLVVGIRR